MRRLILGIVLTQISFSVRSMEKEYSDSNGNKIVVIPCLTSDRKIVNLEQWKIEQSKFLHEKLKHGNLKLDKFIEAKLVNQEELDLLSMALNWQADESLLYRYVRLPTQKRHMLLDIISESKLNAYKLSMDLLSFYVCGLYRNGVEKYMSELATKGEDTFNSLLDASKETVNSMLNNEKNKQKLTPYDGKYDYAIQYARRH